MSSETISSTQRVELNRLKNFPVSFLAVTLGLTGFTLAWQKAESMFHLPFKASTYLLYLTIVIITVITVIYLFKTWLYPDAVKKEFYHPIKINFFPITAKLFLIMSIIFLHLDLDVSRYLWWIGLAVQFIFTLIIMSFWIRHDRFRIDHINPSWFIPVVGCIMVPIAGVVHFPPQLSLFFFSIGLFWWLILTTLVINRIVFHHPLPEKMIPTLFILFAPPVIGFISITKLEGELTMFGNLLYYFSAFLFILIASQVTMFSRLKFYLSWWAYSFPLSALTIGTFLMYHESRLPFFQTLSWILFVLLNIVLFFLALKTLWAISHKHICIEESD